jgi:hypothetical protein
MEKSFGSSSVFSDYGPNALETHDLVRKYFYDRRDSYGLFAHILQNSNTPSSLTGHVHHARYAPLFPLMRTLTYVRQPLSRLVSEYKHFVRLKGYEGTLNEFIREKRVINMQTNYLKHVPLSAIGFIGLSEDYEAGLEMVNSTFDLALPNLNLNIAPTGQSEKISVSDEDICLFNELNKQDLITYQQASAIYKVRKEMFKEGRPYIHGQYQVDNHGVISGFAFHQDDPSPVVLFVELNGENIAEVEAKDMNEQMKQLGSPRKGYVGFRLALKHFSGADNKVIIRVRNTGQPLFDGSIT